MSHFYVNGKLIGAGVSFKIEYYRKDNSEICCIKLVKTKVDFLAVFLINIFQALIKRVTYIF